MKTIHLVALAALLTAQPVAGGEKRALLVAINDYSASEIRPPDSGPSNGVGRTFLPDLYGTVYDAKALGEMLVARYGFERDNIELLTDQDATRSAILRAIDGHLTTPSKPGDHAVFYFAGHGSRLANERSPETDRLDETLVPADSRWGAPDIRDKELRRRFHKILDRGAGLTVILDSCYSGSGTRGLPRWTRIRGVEPDPNQRADASESDDPGLGPEDRGALILSAAQDFQQAWETFDKEGRDRGAFSLALLHAMRAAGPRESAERVFLRTKALLRVERGPQNPVLAGPEKVRAAPLFGGRADHRSGETVVAVRTITEDGIVHLEGGRANGLTVGSELQVLGAKGKGVRLHITDLEGLSASRAQVLPSSGSGSARLEPGAVVQLSRWAAPKGLPLRIWIPRNARNALPLAREIRDAVEAAGIGWSEDPVDDEPTHTLSLHRGSWRLTGPAGEVRELGSDPAAASIVDLLKNGKSCARLFVHLPPPAELVRDLWIGPGTPRDAIEPIDDPRGADYFLVGRIRGDHLEFAWVRPLVGRSDERRSPLPVRSDWLTFETNDEEVRSSAARGLEDTVLRLAKILSWLRLQSPPGNDFPYRLALRSADSNDAVTTGRLAAGTRYGLVLQLRDPTVEAVVPRHVYVFSLDSHGNSTLLFPVARRGGVENRFPGPLGAPGSTPREILLEPHPLFSIGAPYGLDTYFLITSQEPIPNPWILQYQGVRTRGPAGGTALEELLSLTGGTTRGDSPLTPVTWSLERLFLESVGKRRDS